MIVRICSSSFASGRGHWRIGLARQAVGTAVAEERDRGDLARLQIVAGGGSGLDVAGGQRGEDAHDAPVIDRAFEHVGLPRSLGGVALLMCCLIR